MERVIIEKARRSLLEQTNRSVDARAKAMAMQLARALQQLARVEARRASRKLEQSSPRVLLTQVQKDDDDDDDDVRRIEQRLLDVLNTYGLQQWTDAGQGAAARARGAWILEPAAIRDFMRTKEVRLQDILESTRDEVRNSVRDILEAALREQPTPSPGAIARRIKNTFHGKTGIGGELHAVMGEATAARYTTEEGTLYAFSSERAALIARTELAQAENTGIVQGYTVAGVRHMEWLAYRDGNSGARRHDLMHGQIALIGGSFVNPTTGAHLRYPGDPDADISETANCRCTTAPVRL